MHKYGIKMATSVDHAYEIDKGNGNTLWHNAIKKEMTNVGIAFKVLRREKRPLLHGARYLGISCLT